MAAPASPATTPTGPPTAPSSPPAKPVTLRWDNGQGQVFEIALSLDDNYMFTADQRVNNTGPSRCSCCPGPASAREYTPPTAGLLHPARGLRRRARRPAAGDDLRRPPRPKAPSANGVGARAGGRRRLGRLHRQVLAGGAGPGRPGARFRGDLPARSRRRPERPLAGRLAPNRRRRPSPPAPSVRPGHRGSSPAPRRCGCSTATATAWASRTSTRRSTSAGSTS